MILKISKLYRGNGLNIVKNTNGHKLEKIKQNIQKMFEEKC